MSAWSYVLIPLFAIVLIAAVLWVYRLGLGWEKADALDEGDADMSRYALEDEKARLLMQLKDLEHEYALGKLSEADYLGLKQFVERDALRVMDALEKRS